MICSSQAERTLAFASAAERAEFARTGHFTGRPPAGRRNAGLAREMKVDGATVCWCAARAGRRHRQDLARTRNPRAGDALSADTVITTGTGTGKSRRPALAPAPSASDEPGPPAGRLEQALRFARWAAVPFALVYLILMAHALRARSTRLIWTPTPHRAGDRQLFGAAPAHANVVLGEFGWYATLLFDLATKWLPRPPSGVGGGALRDGTGRGRLAGWSVWQVAGRWAAGLPRCPGLRLAGDRAAAALDHAARVRLVLPGSARRLLVLLERRAAALPRPGLAALALAIGTIVGVNAGSDLLVAVPR